MLAYGRTMHPAMTEWAQAVASIESGEELPRSDILNREPHLQRAFRARDAGGFSWPQRLTPPSPHQSPRRRTAPRSCAACREGPPRASSNSPSCEIPKAVRTRCATGHGCETRWHGLRPLPTLACVRIMPPRKFLGNVPLAQISRDGFT